MGEKWICSCGHENDANFCVRCGSRKPEITEAPAAAEEVSTVPEETPAVAEETPAAAEAAPAVTEETPAAEEAAPEVTEEASAITEEAPVPAEETPAAADAPNAAAEETPAVTEAAPEVTEEAPAAEPKPQKAAAAKKKKTWLWIVIAAVLVAAIAVVLILFVFNKKETLYENEVGNYAITVPGGYKIEAFDNGIVAQNKDAVFIADYALSDATNALVYDWYYLAQFKDRIFWKLEEPTKIKAADFSILDPDTYGNDDIHSYSMSVVCEDDTEAMGEVRLISSESLGCYLVSYYMKNDISEKKAEKIAGDFAKFADSFVIHGAPNIPEYTIEDNSDDYTGKIAVRTKLIRRISSGYKSISIESPDEKDSVEVELLSGEKSVISIFSREGITDGQIESSSSEKITDYRGVTYDAFHATYRDNNNNLRVFGIYGNYLDNKTAPGIFVVEYDVAQDKAEWAEEVCHDVLWSWNFDEY